MRKINRNHSCLRMLCQKKKSDILYKKGEAVRQVCSCNMEMTIEKAQAMLEQIAETIPAELYKELNGGILLLPQAKMSPHAVADDLYILGEYQSGGSMGRLIKIYYGSFEKLFGHLEEEAFKERLKKTLFHEFTHHLESLAGARDLEIEDARQLARYRKERGV